ncbi:protein kinase [Histoplasma capsulatum G186AR]|uniref:Protein kinase n=1 Tax=Ajellomyces capsulatus TaxID=5037 RepID=A0A8H7YK72_AJECA|nr:protein kinase [Histoplasma capsulatum]QSS73002.1 protein kinase [Histoplasma capsulatum G186AR]
MLIIHLTLVHAASISYLCSDIAYLDSSIHWLLSIPPQKLFRRDSLPHVSHLHRSESLCRLRASRSDLFWWISGVASSFLLFPNPTSYHPGSPHPHCYHCYHRPL